MGSSPRQNLVGGSILPSAMHEWFGFCVGAPQVISLEWPPLLNFVLDSETATAPVKLLVKRTESTYVFFTG